MKIKLVFVLIILSFAHVASAQYQSYLDGAPVTLLKKIDVEGSEMLYEIWLPATVNNIKGQEHKNVMIKYNLLEDVPYFLGKADGAMSFSVPLAEFVIQKDNGQQQKFKSGFPPIDKFNELTFYEILVDGNVKLLKKVSKKMIESRAYNSATTVKNIVDKTSYYIFEDSKLSPVKKDRKSLIAVVSKKNKIQNYFSDENNPIKKEEDLIRAIEKYNL